MSKILCLAPSGFGKSTSIGCTEEYGIQGLNPDETYVLSYTTKPLPFKGSSKLFPITTLEEITKGRRICLKSPIEAERALALLLRSPYKTIVFDDFNYIMQNWYMDNALKKGWDAPKEIGFFMGKIFKKIEEFDETNKNIIVLAHGEDIPKPDSRIYAKLKTTGRMVDEYVTPEGKFDVTLVGRSRWDSESKKVVKEFITNEDEFYSSPKSPVGMFKDLYIPNDLGLVVETINKYYN
jgi:hypothetical protein